MTMSTTVAALMKAANALKHAVEELHLMNAALESKALARDIKHLVHVQHALAELVLVAARLDSYERAQAFGESLSAVEEMLWTGVDELDADGLWELLESEACDRVAAHVESAADTLSGIDAESEWETENLDEDDE